ncbi:membrane protein [Devosia riboflavina]|uniref:Membrane protein n=1 Tax=Devosia riboflavina TaxID=46914 RepID=A0A087LYS9_9HYPH|nr:membrane protein [Devosia riboflavina]KFL29782.1 membrane protein [Devosia riboflavina]
MLTQTEQGLDRPNRVPEVTVDFWLIKLMAVTVGETAADFLALNLGLGLQATTYLMSAILVGVIALQFAQKRYVPWAYWSAVVMVSVVGTLLTDNLIDTFGVPLQTTTIACTVILAAIFVAWYASEKTLSIHTVVTTRREIFYWLAVLATFALGTAAGDYVSEALGVGYLITGLVFAGIIALIAVAHFVFKANAILAFWLAYIFTRPLGASFGDMLSQPTDYGGMGLGTIGTSAMFLTVIAGIVIYMTVMRGSHDNAQA